MSNLFEKIKSESYINSELDRITSEMEEIFSNISIKLPEYIENEKRALTYDIWMFYVRKPSLDSSEVLEYLNKISEKWETLKLELNRVIFTSNIKFTRASDLSVLVNDTKRIVKNIVNSKLYNRLSEHDFPKTNEFFKNCYGKGLANCPRLIYTLAVELFDDPDDVDRFFVGIHPNLYFFFKDKMLSAYFQYKSKYFNYGTFVKITVLSLTKKDVADFDIQFLKMSSMLTNAVIKKENIVFNPNPISIKEGYYINIRESLGSDKADALAFTLRKHLPFLPKFLEMPDSAINLQTLSLLHSEIIPKWKELEEEYKRNKSNVQSIKKLQKAHILRTKDTVKNIILDIVDYVKDFISQSST